MGKRDAKAFRERFNRWKNGELVYDKGRPILYEFKAGKDEDNPPKNIMSIPEEEILVTPEVNQPIVARPIGHYGPTTNVSKDLPLQPAPKMLPLKTSPRYSPVTNKENKNPFSFIDGSYLATLLPTNALNGGFVKAGTFLQEDVAPRKLKYSTKYDKDVVDLNRVNSRPIFVGGGLTRLGVGGLTNRDEKAKIEGYTPVWINTAFENEYTDVNGNVYHNPEYKNMPSKYARILLHEWAHSEDAEANPEKKYMQWNLDRNELRTLQNAYKPKKSIFANQYPDIFEKKATNREIRYKISEDSGNLTGDALTKYINEMDDDTLILKYWKNSPINGYILQLETPDAKAFKKALIEVAQNNTLRMPDGYLYARNGKDSGIYIKPSHRGRLTALKKRTGKSEAELYRTGSPATRKMITFARNARKWRKS